MTRASLCLLLSPTLAGCAGPGGTPVVVTCVDIPNPVLLGPVAGLDGRGPPAGATHHLLMLNGASESASVKVEDTSTRTTTTTETKSSGSMDFPTHLLKEMTPKLRWEEDYRQTDIVHFDSFIIGTSKSSSTGGPSIQSMSIAGVGSYYHLAAAARPMSTEGSQK